MNLKGKVERKETMSGLVEVVKELLRKDSDKRDSKQAWGPRFEHYTKVYEGAKFDDFNNFNINLVGLKDTVLACFPENVPSIKLVGSSATGTMRRGKEDLDLAVAFYEAIDHKEFLNRVTGAGLNIREVNRNLKYGYLKISGLHKGMAFVLVPMLHPNERIRTYEQDAFYHPDLINLSKSATHQMNVILMKEFFEQIGVYKEVKGISCELMALHFQFFDAMLGHFAKKDSLRINFSSNNSAYASEPLIIDYPFLGGRSFTEKVTKDLYGHIQESARRVIGDFKYLRVNQK